MTKSAADVVTATSVPAVPPEVITDDERGAPRSAERRACVPGGVRAHRELRPDDVAVTGQDELRQVVGHRHLRAIGAI